MLFLFQYFINIRCKYIEIIPVNINELLSIKHKIINIKESLKERDISDKELIAELERELESLNNSLEDRKLKRRSKTIEDDNENIDSNKLGITVKKNTYSLDEFKSYDETNKMIDHLKNNNSNITIRGLLLSSEMGFEDISIEKDFLLELLQEWASTNLDGYENITFELSVFNSSNQKMEYEKLVSQQLYGKNNKYDFFMLDSIWTGKYGEHLIDLQGKIGAEFVSKFQSANLETCIYKNKLKALVILFFFFYCYDYYYLLKKS